MFLKMIIIIITYLFSQFITKKNLHTDYLTILILYFNTLLKSLNLKKFIRLGINLFYNPTNLSILQNSNIHNLLKSLDLLDIKKLKFNLFLILKILYIIQFINKLFKFIYKLTTLPIKLIFVLFVLSKYNININPMLNVFSNLLISNYNQLPFELFDLFDLIYNKLVLLIHRVYYNNQDFETVLNSNTNTVALQAQYWDFIKENFDYIGSLLNINDMDNSSYLLSILITITFFNELGIFEWFSDFINWDRITIWTLNNPITTFCLNLIFKPITMTYNAFIITPTNLILNPIKSIFLIIFNFIILLFGFDSFLGFDSNNMSVDSIKTSSLPLMEDELETINVERRNTVTSEASEQGNILKYYIDEYNPQRSSTPTIKITFADNES
jgi:hypothetical protein